MLYSSALQFGVSRFHAVNGIVDLVDQILVFPAGHYVIWGLSEVLYPLIFQNADVAVYQRIHLIIDQCIGKLCRSFIINNLTVKAFFFGKFLEAVVIGMPCQKTDAQAIVGK